MRARLSGLRLNAGEALLLGIVAALSLWTLGFDLIHALERGMVWTGTEAVYQEDGMQSMMWIQGILHHGASPDLYVLGRTPADYFEPLLGISAIVVWLGAAPYVALLLWKPVALLAIFYAVRAYVHRLLPGRRARLAALALALLFAWWGVIGDGWIVWWTWGYPFALLGLACALGALMTYARDRRAGRIGPLPALLGLMASWLHPWQGETLILILLGSEAAMLLGRQAVPVRRLLLTLAATAAPLAYFLALVHFDGVWQREREAALSSYPFSHVLGAFAPLALGALLGYRIRPRSFLAVSLRVWPLAALAVYGVSEWGGSGPTHALLGLTIPLAVLSVQGVSSLPWRRLTAPARPAPPRAVARPAPRRAAARLAPLAIVAIVGLLTVPGTVEMIQYADWHVEPRRGNANYITHGESAALGFLAHDPRSGGVLTRFYLGVVVPARTGRRTYVGNCYWSEPNCAGRSRKAERLLKGKMSPAAARAFVLGSGARFVLGDCRSRDLTGALAPIAVEVRRFSCATVYVLR